MSLDVYLSCEHCGHEAWSANITHNLNAMAVEGGFYEPVWRPEEVGITRAKQMIPILQKAIADMESDPVRFEKHNAPNGWGLYKNFLPWLRRYLTACEENPELTVRASR